MALAGATAALVLAVAPQAGREGFASSVEREWAIRERARTFEILEEEAADVETRLANFEAQRRRLATGADRKHGARQAGILTLDFNEIASFDEDVAALRSFTAARTKVRWIACFGQPDEPFRPIGVDWLERAASSRWPVLRLEAARAAPWMEHAESVLAPLAFDPDERVARAAREGLLLDPGATGDLVLAFAERCFAEGRAETSREVLLDLARARPDEGLLDRLRGASEATEWRGALEAIRFRWRSRGSIADVVAAFPEDGALAGVFLDAARSARAAGPELGRALLERALTDADARDACLAGAIEALDSAEILRAIRASSLDTDARIEAWGRLRGRVERWDVDEVRKWLAPEVEARVRAEVVGTLRASLHDDALNDDDEGGAAVLLATALDDVDPGVARSAFDGLCDTEPLVPWLDELHAAWTRFDGAERIEALAEFPRGIAPAPFRRDLIELASRAGPGRAAAIELLEAFAPDRELADLARVWLREEVTAFLGAGDAARREHELRAMELVRGVQRLGAGEDVDTLLEALRRVRGHSVEIGKVAAGALGRNERGRDALVPWIARDVPSRIRIEAELMLAPQGLAAAIDGLALDWTTCDFDLRSRIVRACAETDAPQARALARKIAFDGGEETSHRELAIEALTQAPFDFEALEELSRAANLDVRRKAIAALGASGDPAAIGRLRERLARIEADSASDAPGPDREHVAVEREALLSALAEAGEHGEVERAAWLRLPLAEAEEVLQARFRGDPLANPEFVWAAELDFVASLARAGRLAEALEAAGPWRRLDARLLAAFGARAADEDPASARQLFQAALIGLAGEAEGLERERAAFEIRRRLLELSEKLRDWEAFAALASALHEDWRARRGVDRWFERAFGGFDPRQGIDGPARLASAGVQAQAWAALDGGRVGEARELGRGASELVGRSERARDAQRKLEAALAEAK